MRHIVCLSPMGVSSKPLVYAMKTPANCNFSGRNEAPLDSSMEISLSEGHYGVTSSLRYEGIFSLQMPPDDQVWPPCIRFLHSLEANGVCACEQNYVLFLLFLFSLHLHLLAFRLSRSAYFPYSLFDSFLSPLIKVKPSSRPKG